NKSVSYGMSGATAPCAAQNGDVMAKYPRAGSGETVQEADYAKAIIFSADDFEEEGHLLQVVTVPPRTKQRLHFHREQTEVFYVLEGQAVIELAGEEFLARPGDAFVCSPGDHHSLWNRSDEGFRLVVFKINIPQEDDTGWME
ncbi:MAG: cupin domain-containing protein, partial [Anaerolineae bacterium]|nr:cupin domain-containing protein [Anaerolineae bacterium]